MMRRDRREGFTLLELIVVIGLLGVATTLALSAFFAMMDNWRGVKSRTDLDWQAEAAFATLRQDLNSMASPSLAGVTLQGIDRTYEDAQAVVATPAQGDDELTFPTYTETMSGARTSGLVSYQVIHDGGRHLLKRVQQDMAGQFLSSSTVLHEDVDVLWLGFRYAGADGAWTSDGNWSEATPPTAVRVEMTLRDTATGEQVIRQIVLPVHVS